MVFTVSAPGKTILFGEHAVVYSKPAIAASVGLHTYVTVDEETSYLVELNFPALKLKVGWELTDFASHLNLSELPSMPVLETGRALDPRLFATAQHMAQSAIPSEQVFSLTAATAFLYLYISIFLANNAQTSHPRIRFTTNGTLPVGAGLGSSASFSVGMSAALLKLSNHLKDDTPHDAAMRLVTLHSFLGECCIHGNPSGIDNLVATHGGAVYYQPAPVRGDPPTTRVYGALPPLGLVLTDTQVSRRTSDLVAKVALVRDNWPALFDKLMESFQSVVDAADALLSAAQPDARLALKLGELAEINHGLLAACGVSHPALERVREAAKALELGSTKLTGAGGGGCAITITAELTPDVALLRERLPECKVFLTQLGGPGVGWADAGAASVTELRQLAWRHW